MDTTKESKRETHYEVRLHAFGTPLVSGRTYVFDDSAKAAIEDYKKRVDEGTAFVEFGMPKTDGLLDNELINRIASIDQSNVCAKITDIRKEGALIMGSVTLTGPKAMAVREMLGHNEVPVFGMRGFTRKELSRDGHYQIQHVSSWDFIGTEPVEQPQ